MAKTDLKKRTSQIFVRFKEIADILSIYSTIYFMNEYQLLKEWNYYKIIVTIPVVCIAAYIYIIQI